MKSIQDFFEPAFAQIVKFLNPSAKQSPFHALLEGDLVRLQYIITMFKTFRGGKVS